MGDDFYIRFLARHKHSNYSKGISRSGGHKDYIFGTFLSEMNTTIKYKIIYIRE